MATKTAILSVKIVSDAKDFSSKMDQSAGKLDQFKAKAAKLAVPAAAVLAGLGAIAVGAGKMASESEQNFGAVDAVFKEHADTVKKMASKSAETLGLSGSDYAKYSALLGSQLKNAGTPMDELAAQSDKLIGYGADFAAQFGGTVPEAVEALSSALKGEMDPIEKYGISLSQAKIDAEASALGFEKVGGAWESSAKQAAIMSLVSKQGADAMGAFGREAGTAAGQQAIATAKWQDASAALGTVLLPIMTQAASVLADVAKWVMENQTAVTAFAAVIGILAAAIVVLNVALGIMNVIAALNPFVLIAVAVVALIAVIVYLATRTQFFQTIWAAVASFATSVWTAFTGFVSAAWTNTVNFIVAVAQTIGSFFSGLVSGIQNTWNAGFAFVTAVVQAAIAAIIAILLRIGLTVFSVIASVQSTFNSGFQAAQAIVTGVIVAVIATIMRIQSTVSSVINTARSAFSAGFNAMQSAASGAINGVVSGFQRIVGAVQNAIGFVRDLFNMGGMPGWLGKVLGVGGTGFEMAGAFNPLPGELGIGATGGLSLAPMFSGGSSVRVENTYRIEIKATPGTDKAALGKEIVSAITAYERSTGKSGGRR